MIGGCGICVFVWVGQAGTAVVSCDPFWEADHIAVRTGLELRATRLVAVLFDRFIWRKFGVFHASCRRSTEVGATTPASFSEAVPRASQLDVLRPETYSLLLVKLYCL